MLIDDHVMLFLLLLVVAKYICTISKEFSGNFIAISESQPNIFKQWI